MDEDLDDEVCPAWLGGPGPASKELDGTEPGQKMKRSQNQNMKSTTKKDRNGTKIFEGPLLTIPYFISMSKNLTI